MVSRYYLSPYENKNNENDENNNNDDNNKREKRKTWMLYKNACTKIPRNKQLSSKTWPLQFQTPSDWPRPCKLPPGLCWLSNSCHWGCLWRGAAVTPVKNSGPLCLCLRTKRIEDGSSVGHIAGLDDFWNNALIRTLKEIKVPSPILQNSVTVALQYVGLWVYLLILITFVIS